MDAKKIIQNGLFLFILCLTAATSEAQEYRIITTIESIVPGGLGRSRIIEHRDQLDYQDFSTERTEGTDSEQGRVKRKDAKIDELTETKLLNFYSMVGINFQNVASNDALISSKLTEMAQNGWELMFVTSGVESDGGTGDDNGIFITRYVFKR